MGSFELIVNDRRGKNKSVDETQTDSSLVAMSPKAKDEAIWEDVSFVLALNHDGRGGIIIIGKAIGLRGDTRLFSADWLMPPIWPEDLVWQTEAKKRLDTFLDCDCSEFGTCSLHKLYAEQWPKADAERISFITSTPMPKSAEMFFRAQQAAQAHASKTIH